MLIILLLIAIVVSVHEIGHFVAMRQNRVDVEEICLFGMGPVLLRGKIPFLFGESLVSIRCIPLGAFVRPTKSGTETINNLGYNDSGYINFAGVAFNLVLASVCMFGLNILDPKSTYFSLIMAFGLLIIGLSVKYSHYLYVPIGIAFGLFLIYLTAFKPSEMSMGGVATIVVDGEKHTKSFIELLKYAYAMSLSIGLFNTLPLIPLDGGNAMSAALKSLFPHNDKIVSWYRASILFVLVIVGFAIIGDIKTIYNLF
jgi:membrane-associated protease RseP (regulator of RpoE activity)